MAEAAAPSVQEPSKTAEAANVQEQEEPSKTSVLDLPPAALLLIHDMLLNGRGSGRGALWGSPSTAATWRMVHRLFNDHSMLNDGMGVKDFQYTLLDGKRKRGATQAQFFDSLAAKLRRQHSAFHIDLELDTLAKAGHLQLLQDARAVAPWARHVTLQVSAGSGSDAGVVLEHCLKAFTHTRSLDLSLNVSRGSTLVFSDVHVPAAADDGAPPAPSQLERLTIDSRRGAPLILPRVLELRGLPHLQRLTLVGPMHSRGNARERKNLLRLRPDVLVQHQPRMSYDSASSKFSKPPSEAVRAGDAKKLRQVVPIKPWGEEVRAALLTHRPCARTLRRAHTLAATLAFLMQEEEQHLIHAFFARIESEAPAYCVAVEAFAEGAMWLEDLWDMGYTPRTLDQVDVAPFVKIWRSATRQVNDGTAHAVRRRLRRRVRDLAASLSCRSLLRVQMMHETGYDSCLSYDEEDGLGGAWDEEYDDYDGFGWDYYG